MKHKLAIAFLISNFLFLFLFSAFAQSKQKSTHVWEMKELRFISQNKYTNPYKEVTTWVELKGPGFSKRIYGFWDGENIFRVRLVATTPGRWYWTSGSNQPTDKGLNNQSGEFTAIAWTEAEKKENPNRHGFVRPTLNGHAIQYADGTPFFMLGDTWLAGTTYRLPFRGVPGAKNYTPAPGIGYRNDYLIKVTESFDQLNDIKSSHHFFLDVSYSLLDNYKDNTRQNAEQQRLQNDAYKFLLYYRRISIR